MKVKVVIFDLDGTLYNSKSYEEFLLRIVENLLGEMLNVNLSRARRLFRETMRVQLTVPGTVEILGLNSREFYVRLSQRVNPDRFIHPDDQVTSLLKFLRKSDVKVVLHTNSGRPLVLKVLKALGLDESFFDYVLTSDDLPAKPSPIGYLHILRVTGAKPEEAVYVGNRYDVEVKPAKLLGMKTILIGKRRRAYNADHFISSIKEVFRFVDARKS